MSNIRDMRRPMVLTDDPDREARKAAEDLRREAQQRTIKRQAELKQAQDGFGAAMQEYQLLQGMTGAVRHAGTLMTKFESPGMGDEEVAKMVGTLDEVVRGDALLERAARAVLRAADRCWNARISEEEPERSEAV